MQTVDASLPGGILGPELATLSGLSYPTVHYYTVEGVLRATERAANGRGSRRLYAFNDAVAACVVAELREYGTSLDQLKNVAAAIRGYDVQQMRAASRDVRAPLLGLLVPKTGKVERVDDTKVFSLLSAFDQNVGLFVNVSKFAADVATALLEMRIRGPRRGSPKRAATRSAARKRL